MVSKNTTKDFDLIQRDGRKKIFLTVDVETAGNIEKGESLIYDLGFAIHDKQGNIFYKRNFIISEIFDNIAIMNTAYYSRKIPKYIEMLRNGDAEKVKLKQALSFFVKCSAEYNIDVTAAFNLLFDSRAFQYTLIAVHPEIYKNFSYRNPLEFMEVAIFRRPMNFLCIYNYACQVIATQRLYAKTALIQNGIISSNDWISKSNNVRTNAECMQRYISGCYDFSESHTALNDVLIEIQILAKCFRQKKHFDKKILYQPWRIPQNIFHSIQEECYK